MLHAHSRVVSVVIAVILSGVASSASALDTRFHYKVGYDFGGDTLATVPFTNGDTDTVKANEGLYFGAGAAFAANTQYKDALGFVLQVDYRIMEKMNVGVRYTAIEYEQQNSTRSFDGNSIGVIFSGSI